jgi:hypothetical protein
MSYSDSVPDTLDLAEWAKEFAQGTVNLMMPASYFNAYWQSGQPGVWIPDFANAITAAPSAYNNVVRPDDGWQPCQPSLPNCILANGAAQWAVALQALLLAQEMAGNVLSPDDQAKELSSFRGIVAYDQNGSIHSPNGQVPPYAYSMMLMTDLHRLFPSNQSFTQIGEEYIRYDNFLLVKDGNFSYWINVVNPPSPYNAHAIQVYQQALGGIPNSDWFALTRNETAFWLGVDASVYLLGYQGGVFWANPDPSTYPRDAFYVGHTLAYTTALLALVSDARARYGRYPADPTCRNEIMFAVQGYEFMKRLNNMGLLGNFGVSSTLGIMLQLAVQLEQFRFIYPDLVPLTGYYEDAERWTRNTAAEMRVDSATDAYIPNAASSDPQYGNIGARAEGTLLSDATHVLSIPNFDLLDNNDGLWLMRGLHDVWKDTVTYSEANTVAWVNFLLNNASEYMDVYSELPYQGVVLIVLRNDAGSLKELAVRIPSWAGQNVSISMNGQPAAWTWNGSYAVIYPISAGANFEIQFPMAVQHLPFQQNRPQNQHWYEGDYEANQISTYNGVFLGDVLVGSDVRPAGGIPRYQRQNLASLVQGNTATAVPAPRKTVTRFVATPQ